MLNYIPSNIYDPGNWKNIDTLRDLLVERGPIRDNDIIFPRGDDTRQFSTIHYTWILSTKLKLIKSYLRLTMSQERLSKLAILSIENEMLEELEYKNLISQFASQNARKIDFKWNIL